MPADTANTFCPVHKETIKGIQDDLRVVETTQSNRPCIGHEARITNLEKADIRLEADNERQWIAIGQTQRLVWMGVGMVTFAAFVGSAIGRYIFKP